MRARDPAFAGDYLLYIYQRPDTTQAIRRRHRKIGEERDLYVSGPMERLAGLHAREEELVFSHHDNQGREKVIRLPLSGGEPQPLPDTGPWRRTHERNPHLAEDGSVWFARFSEAAGVGGGVQEIHRFDPASGELQRVYGCLLRASRPPHSPARW
jgi:hypothetical protein